MYYCTNKIVFISYALLFIKNFKMTYIKSRGIILTRVQSKAYMEPSRFSSLFNLPYSKDIHYFSQMRQIQLSVEIPLYTISN